MRRHKRDERRRKDKEINELRVCGIGYGHAINWLTLANWSITRPWTISLALTYTHPNQAIPQLTPEKEMGNLLGKDLPSSELQILTLISLSVVLIKHLYVAVDPNMFPERVTSPLMGSGRSGQSTAAHTGSCPLHTPESRHCLFPEPCNTNPGKQL